MFLPTFTAFKLENTRRICELIGVQKAHISACKYNRSKKKKVLRKKTKNVIYTINGYALMNYLC